jgi:osmotically inducible protein OsmC
MLRKARATWKKGGWDGQGIVSTDIGALADAAYSWKTRTNEKTGTNPEELLAGAQASCFAMALDPSRK